jgi:hypothetical protein
VGDHVVVLYEGSPFPGIVTVVHAEYVTVSCLKKNHPGVGWQYNPSDTCDYPTRQLPHTDNYVVKRLPTPNIITEASTNRQQSYIIPDMDPHWGK